MVRATCSALHCPSSSRTHKDLKFHQFPHDTNRRKMWLLACKRSDVIDKDFAFFKHKYLCSKHFQKCMYGKKNFLKKSAVPTLHLSEKPLHHDSSTQTTESIQYVRPDFENKEDVKEQLQNVPSILSVVEKCSTSTYTQTEDMPYDINHVNIKKEIITDTMIEESEIIKQDVEIKTEKYDDDENDDTKAFEEDVESDDDDEYSDSEILDDDIKIEIVENPVLPLTQSTQCIDPEVIKHIEKLCVLGVKPLQANVKGTATTVKTAESCESIIPINMNLSSIMRRQDKSIQTDRVIVIGQNSDGIGSRQSINPSECKCKRYTYDEMTRAQFFRCCNKFLSPSFSNLVRTQMYLDGVSKQVASTPCEGSSSSVEKASCSSASVAAGETKRGRGRPPKRRQVVTPEDVIPDIYLKPLI